MRQLSLVAPPALRLLVAPPALHWFLRLLVVPLALLAAAGCTMPKRSTLDLSEVPKDKVVLVGRLTIDKKLPDSSHVIDVMDATKSGLIRASNAPLPFTETRPSGFEKDDILVKWHDLFSVPFERHPDLFVSGIYGFSFNEGGQQTYAWPVTGAVHVPAGARYVYVGHVALHLDDFFVLRGVKVIDEFEKDAKALARFPGIRKSLFKPN